VNIPIEPERYYHIFNHAVGKENLFNKDDNYYFFLKKYLLHIHPVVDTYAYCLMPNHFHLVISIKEEKEVHKVRENSKYVRSRKLNIENFISKQFSIFFSSYAQSFNPLMNRRGTLFMKPFRRKLIHNEEYLKELIHYTHYNPVHHGFVKDLRDWPFSSYHSFFSQKATHLKRKQVIEWFENIENFAAYHKRKINGDLELDLE
jgi:putative transposase